MSVRASMSNDVLLEEVFVPEERAPVDRRPAPHESWLPDGPAALRVPARARPWMPAMMLGVAQAALNLPPFGDQGLWSQSHRITYLSVWRKLAQKQGEFNL